jgi:hypothetical protein
LVRKTTATPCARSSAIASAEPGPGDSGDGVEQRTPDAPPADRFCHGDRVNDDVAILALHAHEGDELAVLRPADDDPFPIVIAPIGPLER